MSVRHSHSLLTTHTQSHDISKVRDCRGDDVKCLSDILTHSSLHTQSHDISEVRDCRGDDVKCLSDILTHSSLHTHNHMTSVRYVTVVVMMSSVCQTFSLTCQSLHTQSHDNIIYSRQSTDSETNNNTELGHITTPSQSCSLMLLALPHLTLPYGEDVLPPSAEASNGPNAHPRINRKVTKSPSAVLTWVHTNTWNHPLQSEGLLT